MRYFVALFSDSCKEQLFGRRNSVVPSKKNKKEKKSGGVFIWTADGLPKQ